MKRITTAELMADSEGYDRLGRFLEGKLGLSFELTARNKALFCSRLASVMNDLGISSLNHWVSSLAAETDFRGNLVFQQLVHAVTTHTTHFFRDPDHFDFLRVWFRKRLIDPQKSKDGLWRERIRIWCAASSSGEEPLSVLMTLLDCVPELLDRTATQVEILATDVDPEILDQARQGTYLESEMKGISPEQREKYFILANESRSKTEKTYQFLGKYLKWIHYFPANLAEVPLPVRPSFDLVVCRNVLIYFSEDQARRTVRELQKTLLDDGVLILGLSEAGFTTELQEADQLKALLPSIYTK
ncbi:MAG: methyltransferase domain-containing protein [Bdellovibrionales bacterium]|nr:methyltransferase domain-containing protein [Bdellovibrionales bacterium]